MVDVFVSYARKDREFVGGLVEALKSQGWTVWWDPTLIAGQRFDQAIRDALDQAKCVVVIWSPSSIDSQWVQDEAGVGRDRQALVPATIEGVRPPLGFRQLQTVDLTGWRPPEDDDRLDDLRVGIRSLIEGGVLPGASWSRPLTRLTFWSRHWKALAMTGLAVAIAIGGLYALAPNFASPWLQGASRSFEIYDGYGIFDPSSHLVSGADWQECQAQCKIGEACSAFTYFKERQACFLLSSYQDIRKDARATSGVLSHLVQPQLDRNQ
jgi:hypothetical protein